ncbi:MAG TPA: sigma 54-interacting transcriptional regulator [Polyangia bacterium]|nr:sigma 54-interacting transcriptional regulator [Polyangia bacterium]
MRGPSAGQSRVIDRGEFRIGKASANDLSLSDPTVSRFHCVIQDTPRGPLLHDLGSTNGTQVGDTWIERAYIAPLMAIQIGSSTLQMVPVDGSQRRPTPTLVDTRMVGSSAAIQRLLSMLPRVASSGATILLEGETGTGKSLLAEIIHHAGPHPEAPFITVDCGSIPANLIESELFGHERGAFTGATERHIGAFEAAHGGTIFLDEISELPLPMQPKLLRALEERMIKRVGSTKQVRVDLQVIAATNRDLHEAVKSGEFRADLYYRLDAVRLCLPPLRERREDIPQLMEQFFKRVGQALDPERLESFKRSLAEREDWPGNVRELRNAVEKAVLLGETGLEERRMSKTPSPLLLASGGVFDSGVSFRAAKENAISEWERGYLRSLVDHTKGNISHAARLAQMDRSYLRDLLRRYQIAAG